MMVDDDRFARGFLERICAVRIFRVHVFTYVLFNGLFILIDFLTASSGWFFWPMLAWGIGLTIHWLYFKSINIDEEWVEQRTEDVRLMAYDAGHIENIEKRYFGASEPSAR